MKISATWPVNEGTRTTVAWCVISGTVMNVSSAVPLSNWMNRLLNGGTISTSACGRMTRCIRWAGLKLSATQPSCCSLGTDCTAPLTISAP